MEQSRLGEGDRSSTSASESLARGKEAISSAASDAMNAAASDFEALRNDLKRLSGTITTFLAQAGNEAAKSARGVSAALAGQRADLASAARARGTGLISELEDFTRHNPFAALAGAVVVGMLIARWGRRH